MKTQVEKELHRLGKECFINCFEIAFSKKGELSCEDIKKNHKIKHSKEHSKAGLKIRKKAMKNIFDNKLEYIALENCINSKKISLEFINKAKLLLKQTK